MSVLDERRVRPAGEEGRPRASAASRAEEALATVRLERVRRAPAAPALRRPAAARRARPGAGQPAQGAAARRAARRPRPQAAPRDADRAQADPARGRHHLRLRDPRPGGGADDERPDRGLQRRPHRAGRHARSSSTSSRPAPFVAGFVGTSNLLDGRGRARSSLGRDGHVQHPAREDPTLDADGAAAGDGDRAARRRGRARSSTSARPPTTSSTSTPAPTPRPCCSRTCTAPPDARARAVAGEPRRRSRWRRRARRSTSRDRPGTPATPPRRRQHEAATIADARRGGRRARARARRLRHARRRRRRRGSGRQAQAASPPPDVPMTAVARRQARASSASSPGRATPRTARPTRSVDWVTPFEKETGCQVNVKYFGTSDEAVNLMKTGQYDVVSASGDAIAAADRRRRRRAGQHRPGPELRRRSAPFLKDRDWNSVDGQMYGVPHGWGANLLMYNTDVVKPAPTSWGAVFDGRVDVHGQGHGVRLADLHRRRRALPDEAPSPTSASRTPTPSTRTSSTRPSTCSRTQRAERRRVLVGLPQGDPGLQDRRLRDRHHVAGHRATCAEARRRRSRRSCPTRARPAGRTPG